MSIADNIKDAKLDRDISDVEDLCNTKHIEASDPEFENELLFYGQDPVISVAGDVNKYYGDTTRAISSSTGEIDRAKGTLTSGLSRVNSARESISSSAEQIKNSWKRYKEAKAEHKKTMPFSKEAKRAKESMRNCKERISTLNRSRHQKKKSLQETLNSITENKTKVKEAKAKIDKAVERRNQIIKRVREQFKLADKIKAAFESTQYQIDPNEVGNTSKKIGVAKELQKAISDKTLRISLLTPLKEIPYENLETDRESSPIERAYSKFNHEFSTPQDKLLAEKFYLQGQHSKKQFIEQIKHLSLAEPDRGER